MAISNKSKIAFQELLFQVPTFAFESTLLVMSFCAHVGICLGKRGAWEAWIWRWQKQQNGAPEGSAPIWGRYCSGKLVNSTVASLQVRFAIYLVYALLILVCNA